jgi:hypothetical protein
MAGIGCKEAHSRNIETSGKRRAEWNYFDAELTGLVALQ